MIPGPYESNQGFVRFFLYTWAPAKHSFQGGFLYNSGAFTADYFVIFRRGWALFTLDVRDWYSIVAAEEVNGRGE